MKHYITPAAEIYELKSADIITLSAPDAIADYDDTEIAPSGWFDK